MTPCYLCVEGIQKCLSSHEPRPGTGWQDWCLPKKKPTDCMRESWENLNHPGENCPEKLDRCNNESGKYDIRYIVYEVITNLKICLMN